MSLMRRNKLRILPNLARKPILTEKSELTSPQNLLLKVENENNNNEKESFSSNIKEVPKEVSENSLNITSDKINLQPTTQKKELDQGKTKDLDPINFISLNSTENENHTNLDVDCCSLNNIVSEKHNSLIDSTYSNSTICEKYTNSGRVSTGDNNNYISSNLQPNLLISIKEECLKSVESVRSVYLPTATDEDISSSQKKDVKTDFKSTKKNIKIASHENLIEESTTDKHVAMNSIKGKQLKKANISVSPKKNGKKLQNLSRGGKENAVVSKLSLSPTKKLNEVNTSSQNIEIKKEKTKSHLNHIPRKHKPKSLETKNSPYFKRKIEFRSKITPSGELEKSKMTMFDLILWNPKSNPMPQTESEREIVIRNNESNQNDLTAERIEEQNAEEEGLDINENSENNDKNTQDDNSFQNNNLQEGDPDHVSESEEEPATLAPQVKIGPNGELVVDEKSLLIQTTAAKNRDKVLSNAAPIEEDNNSSQYGKWSKRKRKSTEWTLKETARFYKALSTVGTDFSLMSMILSWRSRTELKIKFKKEERLNRNLIDMALSDSTQFDFTIFEESDYDPEEDRKKSKEAEKAEVKRKKEEERKEKRQQRAKEKKLKLEQEKLDKNRKRKLKNVYKKIKRRRKKEPVETTRKRKLSVTIDPQEVICEVVFASEKPVENNCTIQEDVPSTVQTLLYPVENLSSVPVVDVGEDETVTISETPIYSHESDMEEESGVKNCVALPNDVSDVKESTLSIGISQSSFSSEVGKPSEELSVEGYKSPSAMHLPISSPYGSADENLVLMPDVDPCNPSKQIYHVFRLTKDAGTNSDTSCDLVNAPSNISINNDSENVL